MPPRSALFWLCALAAAVFAAGSLPTTPEGDHGRPGGFAVPSTRGGITLGAGQSVGARVLRVVDGDTVAVTDSAGARDTVRYIGIDTPESVKPGTPVQCYAKVASHRNEELVAGQAVRLVAGAEPRDRYGRLLAYVYRASDSRFVNAELVAGGFARPLTIPPNDRYAPRFAALAGSAQRARRGLWGAC